MKKKTLCLLMAVCAMASISAACGRKNAAKGAASTGVSLSAYEVPSLYTRATVPEEEPEYIHKKDSLTELAPVTDADGKTISRWPSITLSGDPDEVIEIEQHCFYEGERFFLFFQEGAKVHGDIAVDMERIMGELEELLGMPYENDPMDSDVNWRYLYFDNAFDDVNRDLAKVNILILKDPENGYIEWAGENVAVLFDSHLFYPENGLESAYHELAHVLQLRQSNPLGRVLEEGIACYAEYQLCILEGKPAIGTAQFTRDDRQPHPYNDEEVCADPIAIFTQDTEVYSGCEQRNYQLGIRFVTFLVEEYGENVIHDICAISLQFDYENTRTDMMIRIVKDATSDDVFERFAEWLPEGWENFTKEYTMYMEQFEPEYAWEERS